MVLLTEIIGIEYVLEYCLIFFIAFVGSFAKDYLRILKYNTGKISIVKVLLSTITASLIVFALSEIIQSYIGIRGLMVCSFVGGLIGFQLLEQISTIDGLLNLIRDLIKFFDERKK